MNFPKLLQKLTAQHRSAYLALLSTLVLVACEPSETGSEGQQAVGLNGEGNEASKMEMVAMPINRDGKKEASRLIDAHMRENAVANVERYSWAAARKTALEKKLRPYLEADEATLWRLLPSQALPRSSDVNPNGKAPPGAGEAHFAEAPQQSRGFGRKFYYHIDPFNHPFKIQSRGTGEWYPKNDFAAYYESALDASGRYRPGEGDPRFLEAEVSGEGAQWVDDGDGIVFEGEPYFVVAHYAFRIWSELIDVTRDLAELYTLTNNPEYAYRAGILLVRMADLYPEMDYNPHFRKGMEASTGGRGVGRVQGCIWETWTAQRLSRAYDWIFDALIRDERLAAFSSKMAVDGARAGKSTPQAVAEHIEENLLKEFIKGVHDGRILGNAGMHQHAMAAAAIALDREGVTDQELDWLFQADGGELPKILVDEMSRDGLGLEAGAGYAAIPPRSVFDIAQLLSRYLKYEGGDLFAEYPKFRRSLSYGEQLRVAGTTQLHWGDGGRAQAIWGYGYPAPIDMALEGFQRFGELDNLREVLNAARRQPGRIRGDIYAEEPDALREAVLARAIEAGDDLWALQSANHGGVGFAVLQTASEDNARMVALNYGPMSHGHGHGDRLGLHLISDGAYMATDLGYPTKTGTYPPRMGWTSHTVSHNTVMVDDQNMEKFSSHSGKTKLFAEAGPLRVMDIDGGGPDTLEGLGHTKFHPEPKPFYPQVSTYRRCVTMIDVDAAHSYYVDVFWVRGGDRHRLIQNGGGTRIRSDWPDWEAQEAGTLAGETIAFGEFYDGPADWSYRGSGMMYVDEVRRAQPDRPFWVEWIIDQPGKPDMAPKFRVHNLSSINEAALGTGYPPRRGPEALRYLYRTVDGSDLETQFLTVFEPYADAPFIREIEVLENGAGPDGFAAALKVHFTEGGHDLLLVTENGGVLKAGGAELNGRLGWLRFDADGQLEAHSRIDAATLAWGDRVFQSDDQPREGTIVGSDERDPANVMVTTDLEDLGKEVIGRYVIVDNVERADASYRIKDVRGGNTLNIGLAALDEIHVDPGDYSKGTRKNIAVGQPFRLANAVYGESDSVPK